MIFTEDFLTDVSDQFYYVMQDPQEIHTAVLDEMLLHVEEGEFELARHNAFGLIKSLTEATTLGEMNNAVKDTYYGKNVEMAKLLQYLSIIKNIKSTTESNLRNMRDQIISIGEIYDGELIITPAVKKVMPQHKKIYDNVRLSFENEEWYYTIRHIETIPTGLFKPAAFKEHKVGGLTIRKNYDNISTKLRNIIF